MNVALAAHENTTRTIQASEILANDANPTQLMVTSLTAPSHGVLGIDYAGQLEYVPNTNYTGLDTFTYKVWDGQEVSDTSATVTVDVLPPVTCTKTDGAINGSTDGSVTFTAGPGATDCGSQTISYTITNPGTSTSTGSVTLTSGESSSLPISYNPTYGGASQEYTVSSDVGTVIVTVYPPIAVSETDGAGDGSTPGYATFSPSPAESNHGSQTVNYTITNPDNSNSTGSFAVTGGHSSSLSFSYNSTYGGTSQEYTVSSDVGTVIVTVYPPIAVSETDGAGDGSTPGYATFSPSPYEGNYGSQTVNYTITNPDNSTSTGSITVTGGQSSPLPISYNSTYGGASQEYTVSSDVGMVIVTVYPPIAVSETDGAGDGSTPGYATFSPSPYEGNYGSQTVNYTITNPDNSTSTGSITVTGGQSSPLPISYNSTYGGASQAYTVNTDVGTVTVTVYPLPVVANETDGAGDGSTDGSVTFTAGPGAADTSSQSISYTITNPDASTSTGLITLTGGQSSSLLFSYNSAYGGASQQYTFDSGPWSGTVTVYPPITVSETAGAGDGSTSGNATFSPSPYEGNYGNQLVNYTISGPGVSTSSSVTVTGGQSSSLSFSYNSTYGGASQAYTVSTDVGTVIVTVYPPIAVSWTEGAGDGSTPGYATFSPSPYEGDYGSQTVNYTITNPDSTTSTGSITVTGGENSSLPISYNSTYGGASQAYAVSSDVGTVTVTVYPLPVAVPPTITLSETDGASNGSSDGAALFTASGGTTGQYAHASYTITYPDGTTSGSTPISLTGGQTLPLSFAYNPAYSNGSSQTYTITSSLSSVPVTVMVYPLPVTPTEMDGATDGSTDGSFVFTAGSGATDSSSQTISYSITNPDGSAGTPGSFALGSDGTLALSFAYNPVYGGTSQQYTVTSSLSSVHVSVTVYPLPVTPTEMDGATDGSTDGALMFTTGPGAADSSSQTISYSITNPDGSSGTSGSFALGCDGTLPLSFAYNPTYSNETSQAYTVTSSLSSVPVTVTVYPLPITPTEMDGATDGSTDGSLVFTTGPGAADNSSQTISYSITNPDGSAGTSGSFALGSDGTLPLSFAYNPAYGDGTSQQYTVTSSLGTVYVNVYPPIAVSETDGAGDGSTPGYATFSPSPYEGDYGSQTVNYTITNPDNSTSTGSITVTGGQSSPLSISYNSTYGGASQAYTVSSDVGTVIVTVYPPIAVSETDGAGDGSTPGYATFSPSPYEGNYGSQTVNYTITNPDNSTNTGSITVTGGENSSLPISYDWTYGGDPQAYTVSSDVGTVTVTVYPLPVAANETDGASNGSTNGSVIFTAGPGAADTSSQTISYTITNPDNSTSTGSFALGGGQSNSVTIPYNPAYEGASQQYTFTSDSWGGIVTVYPLPVTAYETNGASDGSTDGSVTFTTGPGAAGTSSQTISYTITNPDNSTSTGSIALGGGQSNSVTIPYNPVYGDASQQYTFASGLWNGTVTVYPVPVVLPTVTLTETDGATDGSTGGTATFTATGGTSARPTQSTTR